MLSDEEIVKALERAGMEVEQTNSSPSIDDRIVAGVIKKVVQHPNADRLNLTEIETPSGTLSIVCGAPNVRKGLKVAVAQIGSVLPIGDRIQQAKLRGVISEGMLCSARELGVGKDHDGILELMPDVAIGTPLRDLYPADSTIELKTPANRFDVQSIVGLAREIAAMTTAEFVDIAASKLTPPSNGPEVSDELVAERYMLARLSIDKSVPSPPHLVARLQASGMRSVSPVVDITNYATQEIGQPLHAFDLAKVHLPIAVRFGRSDESIMTLDGIVRKLSKDDLIIADRDGPIALAGVMGGKNSEVDADTTEVLLESAVFDRTLVRKMAKRHGLRTEASLRFERGIPVQLPALAMSYTVELMKKFAGGELVGMTDRQLFKPDQTKIELDESWLSKRLGVGVTNKEIVDSLAKLQIETHTRPNSKSAKNEADKPRKTAPDRKLRMVVDVPWWRPDLKLREDIAEEVVRVIGYEKIPSSIPAWRPRRVEFDALQSSRRRVRELLYAAGMFEVMTYSFLSAEKLDALGLRLEQHLKLKNPLSQEQAYLRSSLLPSHLSVLERNRNYAKTVGFYELSKVFIKTAGNKQPKEPFRLAVTVNRPMAAYQHVKGVLDALAFEFSTPFVVRSSEHNEFEPGRSGDVYLKDKNVGRIGQLHSSVVAPFKVSGEVAYFELDLEPILEASKTRQYVRIDRFPTIQRDLSIIVPSNVTWQAILEAAGTIQILFVDDYYGQGIPSGHKAVTLRLVVHGSDNTPTEIEAADFEAKVLALLARKVGALPRD